jgi:hypothetical protein
MERGGEGGWWWRVQRGIVSRGIQGVGMEAQSSMPGHEQARQSEQASPQPPPRLHSFEQTEFCVQHLNIPPHCGTGHDML